MGKKSYDLTPRETEINSAQTGQDDSFRENAEPPPYQVLNFTTDAYEKQPNGRSKCLSDDDLQMTSKTGEGRRTSAGKSSANGEVYMEDAGEGKEKSSGCCGGRKEKAPTVGVLELFRYAGPLEIFMMVIGSLAALATGCAQPMNMVILGGIVNTFIDTTQVINGTSSRSMTYDKLQPYIIYIIINAVCTFCAAYLAMSLWSWAGERQIACIRKKFFRGVLRQDVGWFDTHKVGELNSRFSDDMHKIHEGMGDKIAVLVQWCCTWVVCYIVAFVHGWKLSLIVFAFSPVFVFVAAFMSRGLRSMTVKELAAYAKAGAIAEQALRAIRTVQVFQGQEKEEKKYVSNLRLAKKVGTRKGIVLGFGTGMFWAVIFGIFAAAFYFGVTLIQDENLEPGNILVVTFGVMIGSMSLGNAFPNLEAFTNARAAAVKVYEIIGLCPAIDISSPSGKKPSSLTGVIEFKDVKFRYPARTDVQVLHGLSFSVQPGQTVALVGASGCGKSTTVQLMQRFYDPEDGQVILDGHNIKDLNLKWLRDQIGVVNQEPVLFATTIAENIRYSMPEATMEAVQTAAKEANAHDFIVELPQGYDTVVGERGSHLSGGQKQRIAIARALVKNPRILLLDEATSALDHESEAVVQSALEKAEEGRTTIVIAHRLSTVRNADKVVVIHHGLKKEEGSHTELMEKQGLYAKLVKLQMRHEEEGDDDIDIVEEELDEYDDDENDGASDDLHPIPRVIFRSMSADPKKSASKETAANGELKPKKSSGRKGSSTESTDSTKSEKEEKDEEEARFIDLVKLNAPEWPYVAMGTIMCSILGLAQPSFAFVFAEFLKVFSLTDEDEQLEQARILAGIIGGIGVMVCILRIGSSYSFAKAGSELTARLRKLAFCSMLRQDMSYFDDPENQVGALSTRLSSDAAMVQGATGSKIGQALEALSTIIGVLIVSFLYGWKLTLVILAFMPVLIVAGKVQGAIIADSAKSSKKQVHEAGKICSEAIDNIRTVISLNSEDVCIHKLEALLDSNARGSIKWAQSFGAIYGLSLCTQYFAMAAAYAFGSKLVSDGEMEFQDVFRVFSAVVMGGSSIGRNTSFGLDYTKAKVAAGRLFAIIKKEPKIDVDQKKGLQLTNYTGRVQLDKVGFHYPARDTVRVLAGLSLGVEPGKSLALVGSSGCGKSTVLQLLQRFYDPDSGGLIIDSHDLKDLDLRWFRQQLGIVSQEPTLFDDTIAANIAYGDNSREVPMDEILEAARMANIHNFISDLPMGYETQTGDKGTQLSGGQKQRIAIARALVRQPKILLLDEATSALDTASERVVQEALDKAREGRTCIIIAHRLSTVQNADRIAVLGDGVVQEAGTHAQLLAQKGTYYRLLQAHQLQ